MVGFQANEPGYAWVVRHTWQSWRERYKKNAQRLDKRIAVIVDEKDPSQEGQQNFVRMPEAPVASGSHQASEGAPKHSE